ncbi:MAG TPA: glycosyltransferase family A protein [Candidatus Andersenbacteria bacterium]|nr:glycosyltransferase family A protein [Candidatus Andersenbacteria bacterium]
MKQTLAVWMPNYNHSAYIGRAIEAVATQSRRPDQFFIIDDASTDTSREAIDGYVQKYPWITAIYQEKNTGVLAIMGRGVQEITADYVLMASADDYILPGFFEAAMNAAMEYPDAAVIFGDMRVDDHVGNYLYMGRASGITTSQYVSPRAYLHDYLQREAVTQSLSAASIYKLSALREIGGFRPELGAWTDTFALQAMSLAHGAYYINQPCAVWTLHTASISQGMRATPHTMLGIIRKAEALMKSPRFSSLFPSRYVRMWALKYRAVVWLQYLVAISPRLLQKWYAFVIYKLS